MTRRRVAGQHVTTATRRRRGGHHGPTMPDKQATPKPQAFCPTRQAPDTTDEAQPYATARKLIGDRGAW
jgi:hypothetical protein